MSSNDRKAKAQAASKAANGGANVIVVAGVVIILAMALIVGGVIWASRDGGTAGGSTQLPEGVAKGEPIEPYASAKPAKDAPVVDVYEDFRCPICQVFEQSFGGTIDELASDGKIRLRVHLKTVIDSNTGGDSSAVAGASAVCAADEGAWTEYHSALFARQPAQETRDGFSDDDLTKAAKDAGLSGEHLDGWQQCVDKGTYVSYVKSVDDATVKDGITGTPVIKVAGTKLDWTALVDPNTRKADEQRVEQILTSGKVPEDLVQTQ